MTTNFNYDPYYDDFDEDKNFMRVLFRPGYSVQARELTQLQTILANQIEKFGNHIFKSGSPILGGKVMLDDTANYVVLNSQYNSEDIVPDDFVGKTVISYNTSTKSVRAKVIAVDTTTSNPILVVKYLSGDTFSENDELKISGVNIFAQVYPSLAVGRSYVASIQEGVYYFKGQFVKVVPQFLVLELFYKIGYDATTVNSQPSYKVGLEFTDTIVDEIDDTSLLDPAQGAFNYQAPGATRYTIQTSLSKRTLDSADESSFFEIIRLVDGVKTKEIDYPIYSEIEKTLARRTYDESGNYTVDPFVIALEEGDSANGKFNAVLDAGKAYVGGYEFQTIAPTTIELNRGRDVISTSDYDLALNYTSYVVLANVAGSLDITTFPQLDVHSVPVANVNLSNDNAYNSTKIGTLRASMIKYNDATNSDIGTTHSFYVNVFDANGTAITGTIPSSGSSNTVIKLPATFSSTAGANAYANMYFTLTDNSIAPVLIASSNSVANTVTLTAALPFTPASNTFSIQSDFKNAEAILNRSGTSVLFSGDVHADSKDSVTGDAFIKEPNRTSLIFSLPYDAVKEDTISNFDFFARKVYSNKASSGGIINIQREGTDTFAFASTPGVISDTSILNNIICFIRYNSVANTYLGITPNTVCSLANSNFTVTAISSSEIEVDFNVPITDVVRADFIITTKVNNAENGTTGAIRGKQLIPLLDELHDKVAYEMNPGGDTLPSANSTVNTTFTGGVVYEDIGATWFTGSSILQDLRTPGKSVSLQVPDCFEIVRITDSLSESSNVTTAMLSSSTYDVTANYEFDNGQRKTHYDHATIKLKRGYSSPRGQIYVQYKYLKHSQAPSPQNDGLFTVDSYLKTGSNFTYDQIGSYGDKTQNKLISLRSAFDFRPTRAVGANTISGAVNPDPDLTGIASFDCYLGRIDQLVVKPSKEFAIVSGKSAVSPVAPVVQSSDMLIYTLNIPPYTSRVNDVRVDFKNNRRYTMRDIGVFENRIKQLEYYVALNSLEKDAASYRILDSNGLERSKYGILVDNFSDNGNQATYSDVGFDNRCLAEGGELKPASLMRTFKLNVNPGTCSGNFKLVGKGSKKLLMLDYTTEEFAKQGYATKSMPMAGALFASFNGTMKLYPEYAADVDTNVNASVTMNSLQGLQTAFQNYTDMLVYIATQEGYWSDKNSPFAMVPVDSWYSQVLSSSEFTTRWMSGGTTMGSLWQSNVTDTYLNTNYNLTVNVPTLSTSQQNIGQFVTDFAIQPYIKPHRVVFNSQGLRPNTSFFHFFDGVNVDNYISVPNKVTINTTSSAFSAGEFCIMANDTTSLITYTNNYNSGNVDGWWGVYVTNCEPNSNTIYIHDENGNQMPTTAGKYIKSPLTGNTATITAQLDHRCGYIDYNGMTSNTITLQSDAPSVNIAGNTIYLIHKVGAAVKYGVFPTIGEALTVNSYNVTTKVATVDGTIKFYDGNFGSANNRCTYSIGKRKTNQYGQDSGVLYIPGATFRSGERAFRTTESFNNSFDKDAISFAEHTFVSSGITANKTELVDTVYNVSVAPKIVGSTTTSSLVSHDVANIRLTSWVIDPLAQTFYVDPQVYPNGLFLSDVDLFFRNKDDDNLPVTLQIRPTVNGSPSTDFWYPESVVVKYPTEINVSETPDVANANTSTKFEFDTPVFLKPGLYAMCTLTSSPDYTMWIAEKGATTIKNEFVGVNPYIGTLYKSQNAMEYVPSINEDMMFRLNRCKFKSGVASFAIEIDPLDKKYAIDRFRVIDTEIKTLTDAPISIDYSFVSKPYGGVKETTYRSFTPHTTYSMGNDIVYGVGDRRKEVQQKGDFAINIDMSSSDDAISPVVSSESLYLNAWENFADSGALSSEDFNIVVAGSGYSNANSIIVNSTTGTGANIFLNVDGNGNVMSVNVVSGGSGYTDDYTISYYTHPTKPATIVLNSEYDSSGGPCDARYITKAITLADGFDAGDLRVFLAANKPGVSEIEVFYKVLSSTDATDFKDRPYQKMECFNPTTTPSQTDSDYREYEYRPSLTDNQITYTSDGGVTYDSFKTFSIKIIMTTSDPAVVPKVKDLRIVALPAE